MKQKILIICTVLILTLLSPPAFGQWAEWVNNQGCYCGGFPAPPVSFIFRGNGTAAEKTAASDQMQYWNRYASIYGPSSFGTGYGAPGNGLNEVNTFITIADAYRIYGIIMDPGLYSLTIIMPEENFGYFDECKDFNPIGCGPFTETDVLINAGFEDGWTTDPNDSNHALIQSTALHEIGHTWGAHHVFTLPAFGNSYSVMNYMNDDSGRFVTRMDANTIRAHYPGAAQSILDVGIFPFIYGNDQYAETYTSVSPTMVQRGQSINISNFLIQNIGTSDAPNTLISFYLSTDTSIENTDYLLGTVSYPSFPVNAEHDLNATFVIPGYVPDGIYYIGAIVTVNGVEDPVSINNKFVIGRYDPVTIVVNPKAPWPDIKANNSDGPVTISRFSNLSIEVSLDPGNYTGVNADWWALANTPWGWYHYNVSGNSWTPGQVVTHQGPLFNLSRFQVFSGSGLPAGTYTFYFGVDMNMNGWLNMDQIYYDSVSVTITP